MNAPLRFLQHAIGRSFAPEGATPFTIVFLPRTGSNHLADLLDTHPEIICHHEVFNADGIHRSLSYKDTSLTFGTVAERDANPWDFMRRVFEFTDGASAVGFKVTAHAPPLWPLLSLLVERRVKKIVLSRRGLLHAYTSGLIAHRTKVWSQTEAEKARGTMPQTQVPVDLIEFRRFARKHRIFYGSVRNLLRLTGQAFVDLAYEDIDQPGSLDAILRYLGVRPDLPVTSRTVRQNDPDLRSRIENYEQVFRQLSGHPDGYGLQPP